MFGNNKKSWGDRIRERLTEYIDQRFDDYRGQLSHDVSEGISILAGLIAIWTVGILLVVFVGFSLALLLGWGLSYFMGTLGYLLGFVIITLVILGGGLWVLSRRVKLIERPVFKLISQSLRAPNKNDDDDYGDELEEIEED